MLAIGAAALVTEALDFRTALFATALLAAVVLLTLIRPAERSLAVLVSVLFLSLFTPALLGGENTPVRAEDLVIVATAGLLLLSRVPIRFGEFERGFAALAGAAALAMLGSSLLTDLPSSWSDLFFFLRLAKYALVAFVVRQLAPRLGRHERRLLPVAVTFFTLFAFVGVAQYFGSATATTLFPVQNARADLLLQGASWRRAVGPIGNSNYFGFVCSIGCAMTCAWVAYMRSSFRSQVAASAAMCLLFAGIVTSGSRTALFAGGLMLCVVLLPVLRRVRAWRNIGWVVVAIAAGTAFLGRSLENQPVIGRFSFIWSASPANGGSLVSFQERQSVWAQALSDVKGHWLFGLGPGKGVLSQWVDNDFIRIFRDFGAIGATAFVLMLAWWAWRWWKDSRTGQGARGHVVALAILLGMIVMGTASDVFYQPQVMSILMTLLAFLTWVPPQREGTA